MSRWLLCLVLVLASCVFPKVAEAQEAFREPEIIQLYPASDGRGEVALLDTAGQVLSRIRGFKSVAALEVAGANQLLVVDEGRREILLLDISERVPKVSQTWSLPESATSVVGVTPLPGDSVVVLDRAKGPIRVGGDSTQTLISGANLPSRFDTIALFPDGRLVVGGDVGEGSPCSLYLVDPQSWQVSPLELSSSFLRDGKPARVRLVRSLSGVYSHYPSSHEVCEVTLSGNTLSSSQCLRLPHAPALLARDSSDSFISLVSHGFLSRYQISQGREKQITLEFIPLAMVFEPTRGVLVAGHQRAQVAYWPDPKLYAKDPAQIPDWGKIATYAVLAFLATLFVYAVLNHFAPPAGGLGVSSPTAIPLTNPLRPPSVLVGVAVLISLEVTRRAYAQLFVDEHLLMAGIWFMLGAVLFAVVTKWWYRRSSHTEPQIFALPLSSATGGAFPRGFSVIAASALLALSVYIEEMRRADFLLTYKTTLWFCALAIAFAWLCLDIFVRRAATLRVLKEEWFFILFPLGVGCFTFFYHLTTVPVNTHFDFGIPGLWAWQVATGRVVDIFQIGYTPVPVFGLLPDILGMFLFGGTPLGYRFGPALYGLSGLIPLYILGREYRGKWVGLWSALFLAGNTAYIHFSRLSTAGAAITSLFWVLAFFVIAWRYNWASLWVMTGILGGFSMYQWPVARVGMASVVLAVILISLRHPKLIMSRWRGYWLGLVGFVVMIAPLIWGWRMYPSLMFPRAGSIDPIVSPYSGILGLLHTTFGPQFFRCLGWFFFERDHSSQGSMFPCLNEFEAILCIFGFALFLFSGRSVNVLLGALLLVTVIIGGSLTRTAWYTRLLPTVAVSAVACAQATEVFRQAFASLGKRASVISGVLMIALVTFASPVSNLKTYLRFESGAGREYLMEPMVGIAKKIWEMGPEYKYGLVVIGSPTWSIKSSHPRMLPFIMERTIRDFVELDSEALKEITEPYVFFVQAQRVDRDVPVLLRRFPGARVDTIEDLRGRLIAKAVIVNAPQ